MKKASISTGLLILYFGISIIFLTITFLGDKYITVISQNLPVDHNYCVIIDAGHGLPDGGATSVTGVLECDLNLEIAHRTDAVMALLGIPTKMMRESKDSVYTSGETIAQKKISDIRNRVNIVNSTENAVLISIHQNHFTDSKYRGAQVFYASTDTSQALALNMQQAFINALQPNNNRKPKKCDNVYLMEHINCPAILIECGFLSNPEEDALLSDPEYQKKIASVLAISIANYLDRRSLD